MTISARSRRLRPALLLLATAGLLSACGEDGGGGREVIVPPDASPDTSPPTGGTDASAGGDLGQPADRGLADVEAPDGPATDAVAPPGDTLLFDAATDATPADAGPDAAVPAAICNNGADDDADGQTDYPLDPGCQDADDGDEADPAAPACADGEDNDADGLLDGDDPGCAGPADPNENDTCGDLQHFRDVTGQRRVEGDTTGLTAAFDASCRTNVAPEAIFLVTVRPGLQALALDTHGSGFDTVLSVRRACAAPESEVACADDAGDGRRTSELRLDAPAGDYYVIVDGFRDGSGPFVLNVRAEVPDGSPCPAEDAWETCGLGSVCTDGTCQRAACFNGQDEDDDGDADWPNDPGCEAPEDQDETDPPTPPQCANGQDDDFNGLTDYPADPSCTSAADDTETPPPDCSDGLDNDEDGLIDLDDPGCLGDPTWPFEWNQAACRDGTDNDEDGRIDYPNDPGCTSLEDAIEDDPAVLPACANGLDDDANGATDFPDDFAGCVSAADEDEAAPCDAIVPEDITGQADVRGNNEDAANGFSPDCNPLSGPEVVFLWRVEPDRELAGMRLATRGSRFDTLLSVRDRCEPDRGEELACSDFGGPDGSATLDLGPQAVGTELWIFLDSNSGGGTGIYRLQLTPRLARGARCGDAEHWICGDGLTCQDDTCQPAECSNGQDDDGDGLTDWPAEPGCASPGDDDETDPARPADCSNGLDDDLSGLTDYPADPGCAGAGDEFEGPDCSDGQDNDGDGNTDFDADGNGQRDRTADNDCVCAADPHESFDPECGDGCDNDGDALIDLEDPGCLDDPGRDNEFNVAQCRDGIDNDANGFTDFPSDPGCPTRDSPIERAPPFAPACADGVDNDGDGTADHPSQGQALPDDGCNSAADTDERGPCDTPKPELPAGGVVEGSTADGTDEHQSECGFNGGAPEAVFVAHIPFPAQVVADTNGSSFDTILYARKACQPVSFCPAPVAPDAGLLPPDAALPVDAGLPVDAAPVDAAPEPVDAAPVPDAALPVDAAPAPDAMPPEVCTPGTNEVACDDDGGDGVQSRIELDWPGGDLYVFVDGFGAGRGEYLLNFRATFPLGGLCDPALPAYAACETNARCEAQPDATFRCVP